jgi:hypothetical protein
VIGVQTPLGEQLLDVAVRKGKAQIPWRCIKKTSLPRPVLAAFLIGAINIISHSK